MDPIAARALLLLAPVFATLAGPAQAQRFDGTFSSPAEDGGAVVVSLRETGDGRIVGSFHEGSTWYWVDARLEGRAAVGWLDSAYGRLAFEAERWNRGLALTMYGIDELGEPDYGDYRELELAYTGAAIAFAPWSYGGYGPGGYGPGGSAYGAGAYAPYAGGAAGYGPIPRGNPLASGPGPATSPRPADDPFWGTFSDGYVTLTLATGPDAYEGTLTVGGNPYTVRATRGAAGDASRIEGSLETRDGAYEVVIEASLGGLVVTSDGSRYDLRYVGAPAPYGGGSARPPVPGYGPRVTPAGRPGARSGLPFVEDHPIALRWTRFLTDRRLARVSDGPAGEGRSDIHLCGDRTFELRGAGAPGFGRTSGSWRVVSDGLGALLVLTSADGTNSERLLELDGNAVRVDGVRSYLAPADRCGGRGP